MQPTLVKVSGHELDDPAYLAEFAAAIKSLNTPTVVVHGGGAEITAMQKVMGIEPRYLDGVRITDQDSLKIAEMVMSGSVNKRLVRCLLNAGLDAFGLSGVDRGLVRARQMQVSGHDMGFTGEVVSVRGEVILDLLEKGITPVISPVSLGEETNFNVNADHVAGAVAAALEAEKLVFVSNVEGVLKDGAVIPQLTPNQVGEMIADGTIFGGMIPKVKTALESLAEGVAQAVITNLKGLSSGGGTVFAEKLD